MLTRIISGGQTGCDQAGLRAARACGLETGGYAAMGWLVETPDGRGERSAPWLAEYGLVECDQPGYAARRRKNVRHSDGTLLLGRADSHGSRGVIADCFKASKPWFHVANGVTRPHEAAEWVVARKIQTLNVAGNRESSDHGIGDRAERFLTAVFRAVIRGQSDQR